MDKIIMGYDPHTIVPVTDSSVYDDSDDSVFFMELGRELGLFRREYDLLRSEFKGLKSGVEELELLVRERIRYERETQKS